VPVLNVASIALTLLVAPAPPAPAAAELGKLLDEFLAGASRNDAEVHDRFWADELVYTGSSGRRIGKADILKDVRSAPAPRPGDPKTAYSAEDVRIQQYGDTAIVAFRLVGRTEQDGRADTAYYLNSGTFLKRNGRWQVVNWQATRQPRPEPEEEAKKGVAAVHEAFHRALLAADLKALGAVLDESFVWTHDGGERVTRETLLETIGSGKLKYSRLETSDVAIALAGETAIVRGATSRQRSSIPGAVSGDASPFTAFYTLTLVTKGGAWKAVALHTSRP
jgi:ketosteroid isomerase-like protein